MGSIIDQLFATRVRINILDTAFPGELIYIGSWTWRNKNGISIYTTLLLIASRRGRTVATDVRLQVGLGALDRIVEPNTHGPLRADGSWSKVSLLMNSYYHTSANNQSQLPAICTYIIPFGSYLVHQPCPDLIILDVENIIVRRNLGQNSLHRICRHPRDVIGNSTTRVSNSTAGRGRRNSRQ